MTLVLVSDYFCKNCHYHNYQKHGDHYQSMMRTSPGRPGPGDDDDDDYDDDNEQGGDVDYDGFDQKQPQCNGR